MPAVLMVSCDLQQICAFLLSTIAARWDVLSISTKLNGKYCMWHLSNQNRLHLKDTDPTLMMIIHSNMRQYITEQLI